MLHTMLSGRCDAFNKGSRNGSFGCVNLPDEVLNYMYNPQNETFRHSKTSRLIS